MVFGRGTNCQQTLVLIKSTAISKHFIISSMIIVSLNTITAWKLNWGWPNKVTSPIVVLMMSVLIISSFMKSKHSPQVNSRTLYKNLKSN
ncbi:MAG: hypothetical protein P1U74_06805 [Legionellaceae bacterium]|nr:hypothetical protein [Legionellaceae bacterium]